LIFNYVELFASYIKVMRHLQVITILWGTEISQM